MRIVHTSDWHLGKVLHGESLLDDQQYILNELTDYLIKEQAEVLLISGDLYDRPIPPVDAITLLNGFLEQLLSKIRITVIIISGNHDSAKRMSFGTKLLKTAGVHIVTDLEQCFTPIKLNDEYGEVCFYPIPFVDYAVAREYFNEPKIRNFDKAYEAILGKINEILDTTKRNICLAHAFIIGDSAEKIEQSESERPLVIGGTEYVSYSYFTNFDYVALGHIHKPQKVKQDNIRYSGSLLKYSFSEYKQKKSITDIDLQEKNNITIKQYSLTPIREVRQVKGKLTDLLTDVQYEQYKNDYVLIRLTDKGELVEPMSQLRTVFPKILKLERIAFMNNGTSKASDVKADEHVAKKTITEVFSKFYEDTTSNELSSEQLKIITKYANDTLTKGSEQ